ncbi:hypothetical protein GCM10023405_04030 [Streptomonospora salina]
MLRVTGSGAAGASNGEYGARMPAAAGLLSLCSVLDARMPPIDETSVTLPSAVGGGLHEAPLRMR